jgi:hypothetical protein
MNQGKTILLLLGAMFAPTALRANLLIGAYFVNAPGYTVMSGTDAYATSAAYQFGGANVWNALMLGGGLGDLNPVTDPSFASLVDSQGNTTSVGLQFTGLVDTYFTASPASAAYQNFIYLNSGVLDWELTGLAPGAPVILFIQGFGSPGQGYRAFEMSLDTNGDGTLDSLLSVDSVVGGLAQVTVSPTGTILGEMQYASGQPSWTGLEVLQTPEPGAAGLCLLGVTLVLLKRRVKR